MIIYSHPRSGSTALLKIYKWINRTVYGVKTLDLGEWLNIGALHDARGPHARVVRDSHHNWRPFYQPLIQHFIHNGETTPLEHTYCEIDTRVFDLDIGSKDFVKRAEEQWPSKGNIAHGDPVGHPLKETTKRFTKDQVFPHMVEQQRLRLKYVRELQKHNKPFVVKIFPGYKKFFEDRAKPHYPHIDFEGVFGIPQVYSNDCIIISNNPGRSMLSQGILLKYKYEWHHNYMNKVPPVEVEPGLEINYDFIESSYKIFANLYDVIRSGTTDNIITKDTLFKTQTIRLNNKEYNLKEYFNKLDRSYAMPYTRDLEDYFVNGKQAVQQLNTLILKHYPDIVDKYGIKIE